MVKPIPDGYTAVTPYIIVDGASDAIAFYEKAFGAQEVMRLPNPETGKVMHAEITIDGAHVMVADPDPNWGPKDPKSLGGVASSITLYLLDMEATFARAVEAGADVQSPPMDMFWGDRMANVVDPFGHVWSLLTHTADLTEGEIQKNFQEMMASGGMCPATGGEQAGNG